MRKHSLLLHSAAAVLALAGAAVPAQAKGPASSRNNAEIDALKAEIEVLKAQVGALIANQQQVQRTAEQAQAQVAVQE